jgi:GNAT superfamily N-acetyltransferase
MNKHDIELKPLAPANWEQFETLMGDKGGCAGCWCMFFRLPAKEFAANKYDGNKDMMRGLVREGKPTGLIATLNQVPVGWIALAPREDHIRIEKSRSFKRIDDKPVWSITCFFIRKEYRRMGLSKQLIAKAVAYARKRKIKVLEAYPAIPYDDKVPAPFLWVGILSAFVENGFSVVQQNGKSRAMVRLELT